MKIFGALGLGLAIIVVRLLMPEVFGALESVLLKFFQLMYMILSFGYDSFESGSFLPAASQIPMVSI